MRSPTATTRTPVPISAYCSGLPLRAPLVPEKRGLSRRATRGKRRVATPRSGLDVRDFPGFTLCAGERVFRIHRRGFSPWWFSNDGSQRFDVPTPYGTCYFAECFQVCRSNVWGGENDGLPSRTATSRSGPTACAEWRTSTPGQTKEPSLPQEPSTRITRNSPAR
jgi:hypothetical protein